MSVRRRTSFAVPLILVVGCSRGQAPPTPPAKHFPGETWNVTTDGDECRAYETEGPCPAGATCNPPPPRDIECPADAGTSRVTVGKLPDASCVIVPDGCTEHACATRTTPCPLEWGKRLPLKGPMYQITRAGTECYARPTGCDGAACERAIACPAPEVTRIATRQGDCYVAPDGCTTADCLGEGLPCPLPEGRDFVLRWDGTRSGSTCSVKFTGTRHGAQTKSIACPVDPTNAPYFRIDRKTSGDGCVLRIGSAAPVDLACPD